MENKKVALEPMEGFSEGIGLLLAGMEDVRAQLRETVLDLSDEAVNSRLRPEVHSIAQLVLHCGEAEWWWIQCVVGGKEVDDILESKVFWDVLDETNEPSGITAAECISEIDDVSTLTRNRLAAFSDEDLDTFFEREKRDGSKEDFSLRWILHHLIDHEAQHKGQILMLKRLLSQA